ncbi:hypothetical protein K8Z49_24070 [Actinomadura madurae]|uniref:hypothetical protein n=1 Tax=Actinomadura madurae TaxID=1993 RepID=UPI00399B7F11
MSLLGPAIPDGSGLRAFCAEAVRQAFVAIRYSQVRTEDRCSKDDPSRGWSSPPIVAFVVAGVVLLGLFVLHERRADAPLVDRDLAASHRFAAGNLTRGLGEFASLGLFFGLSHLLQVQLGHSALVAGALLMSIIAGAVVVAPIAESLTGKAPGPIPAGRSSWPRRRSRAPVSGSRKTRPPPRPCSTSHPSGRSAGATSPTSPTSWGSPPV